MDVEECIKKNVQWPDLSPSIKNKLSDDPKSYEHRIVTYSLRNQTRYDGNIVQKVLRREKKYYQLLLIFSRRQHMIYPYHLQDKLVPGLGATAFLYYREMLLNIIRQEKSYDCLPNFTAADCLRLLGIGRNQYIELMNKYKSMLSHDEFKLIEPTEILEKMLPDKPIDEMYIAPWYVVRIGSVTLADIERSTMEERKLIDQVIDAQAIAKSSDQTFEGGIIASGLDVSHIRSLHSRGLIYFVVPVGPKDRIYVPTLEGFVMNRINGDNCEAMLYKLFVSVNDQTTIEDLAADLMVDVSAVQHAASVFCRLGFANKRMSEAVQSPVSSEGGTNSQTPLSDKEPCVPNESTKQQRMNSEYIGSKKKAAFIFDSTITAYLMMGNLAPGLKRHAVTMFEVGKLADESLDSLMEELNNLCEIKEGEARVYSEHAVNLRASVQFLRSYIENGQTELDIYGVDLLRCGSLLSLDSETRARILNKNYSILLSLAPLTYEDHLASTFNWPSHLGPPVPEANSPWFRLALSYYAMKSPSNGQSQLLVGSSVLPALILARGARFCRLPHVFRVFSSFLLVPWGHDPIVVSSSSLLRITNDALTNTAVLIQAINFITSEQCLRQRYIALPISAEALELIGVSGEQHFFTCLTQFVDLTSVAGYATVLSPCKPNVEPGPFDSVSLDQLPCFDLSSSFDARELMASELRAAPVSNSITEDLISTTEPSAVLPESELIDLVKSQSPIYFSTIHLGVPLFNAELNRQVLENATNPQYNLVSTMRSRLNLANENIVKKLHTFIYDICSAEWPTASSLPQLTSGSSQHQHLHLPGPWPLPTRSLLCADNTITEWQ